MNLNIILSVVFCFLSSVFTLQAHIPDSLLKRGQQKDQLPLRPFLFKSGPKAPDTLIVTLLSQVNPDSIGATIQQLQDYGTRMCTSPQAFLAQDWIKNKLSGYGLTVYTQDFPQPAGSSDNVISILPGTTFPDQYIVMGAHYDSYTGGSSAPGADDNASGSAGIIEIARILSQYTFDRSLVFCLWSAEELGLYGSTAYAQEAANNNMNILGYLNLDMCGYLYGTTIKTNVVGPAAAQPLLDFYDQVCGIYLPDFQVTIGGNLPGGSDHMSFNNNGYMGIFPFEDVNHYSPYIHTPQDLLGISVNSLPMAAVFTKSVMATGLEMAIMVPAPINLRAMPTTQEITLSWQNPGVTAAEYHIFRDDMNQVYATTTDTFFIDQNVITGETYTYAVTLVTSQPVKESDKSDKVLSKAVGPLVIPYSDHFENGLTYWISSDGWDLTTSSYHSASYSLTDSPLGNYANNTNSSVYLIPFSLAGSSGGVAGLSFWTKFSLENTNDNVFLEVSDGGEYQAIASFTGIQNNWMASLVSLQDYIDKPYVSLRFRIESNNSQAEDGFYVDDLLVAVYFVGIPESDPRMWQLSNKPNPFTNNTGISFINPTAGNVKLEVFNSLGECIETLCDEVLGIGSHQFTFNNQDNAAGIYYYRLTAGNAVLTRKMVQTGR